MDQVKIGKFIAELRRRDGLTQESLGEKLGVTNKTVSRWENGNYMPDIETLQLLGQIFGVSINELLAGELLSEETFRQRADENLIEAVRESAFSFEEKKAFFIRKWRQEHIAFFALLGLMTAATIVVPILIGKPYLVCIAPLVALIGYAWQNNCMMISVENHLFGEIKDSTKNSCRETSTGENDRKRKNGFARVYSTFCTMIICIGLLLNGFELISAPVFRAIVFSGAAAQIMGLIIILGRSEF